MAKQQTSTIERTRTNVKEPNMYKVIFHNDDFTTFEFVIGVLKIIFHKSSEEAERLTLAVDQHGKAVVGIYSYDMAITKIRKATIMAREQDYPLLITYEKV